MTMKAGEAEVGMNRSGSQLHRVFGLVKMVGICCPRAQTTYLRRQNMITTEAWLWPSDVEVRFRWVYMKARSSNKDYK